MTRLQVSVSGSRLLMNQLIKNLHIVKREQVIRGESCERRHGRIDLDKRKSNLLDSSEIPPTETQS